VGQHQIGWRKRFHSREPIAVNFRRARHMDWLPAAIGAALAEPEAIVACFTGDGSLLMNIQELATLLNSIST